MFILFTDQSGQIFQPIRDGIGRSWAIWPNISRVTVGSAEDMKKFCAAVDRVYKA